MPRNSSTMCVPAYVMHIYRIIPAGTIVTAIPLRGSTWSGAQGTTHAGIIRNCNRRQMFSSVRVTGGIMRVL